MMACSSNQISDSTEMYQEEVITVTKIVYTYLFKFSSSNFLNFNIVFQNKTLRTLEFRNPGKSSFFSTDVLGKRKPKSRAKYDEKISNNFNISIVKLFQR